MWELQGHMQSYIAPSIHKAAQQQENPSDWLADRYADQHTDTEGDDCGGQYQPVNDWSDNHGYAMNQCDDTLIEAIAEKTIEYASTTNGGWEVYLDNWTSIPWCSDDEMQEWYA